MIKLLWVPMVAVAASFIVTLAVFPGVTSAVPSERWGDWMPIVMMTVFNVGDLIGKTLPFTLPVLGASAWTPWGVLRFALARLPLIPLMVLCATPVDDPAVKGEGWGLFLMAVIGVTGGYSATLAMAIGPTMVPKPDREMAGAVMTVSLLSGLVIGATIAIGFADLVVSDDEPANNSSNGSFNGTRTIT